MGAMELKLLQSIEDYVNVAVKRDLIERKIDILRNKISNIKEGLSKGSLSNCRREVVKLLEDKSKADTSVSNARSIYLSILSNSEYDSIKKVFNTLLGKRNNLINLLQNDEQGTDEMIFENSQKLSYYNAIISYISMQHGMELPADFVKKLKD